MSETVTTEELLGLLKENDKKKKELKKIENAIIFSLKNGSGGTHPNPTHP